MKYKLILLAVQFLATTLMLVAEAKPTEIFQEIKDQPAEGEESDEFPNLILFSLHLDR